MQGFINTIYQLLCGAVVVGNLSYTHFINHQCRKHVASRLEQEETLIMLSNLLHQIKLYCYLISPLIHLK